MQLSETVKLYPTEYQAELIRNTMSEYISTVNNIVSDYTNEHYKGIKEIKNIKEIKSISKLTTADVKANLPSALCNQCIRDAKSIVKKYNKECKKVEKTKKSKKNKNLKNIKEVNEIKKVKEIKVPVLKKLCCYINNQNFKIQDNYISLPIMVDGRSKRILVKTKMTDRQKLILSSNKLGTMRIVVKNKNTLVTQFVYETSEIDKIKEIDEVNENKNVMGVDLGIKCPAVSYCTDGSVKFYGNGRKNKYMRRHYANLRKRFQKAKNPSIVKRIKNKEQRVMKDIDHKISREIVNTAKEHKAKVIKLEQLENIRSTTRTSRKNNPSLHTWSFYRLAQYIEYKAKLAGIEVEHVNPAYTSQKCPKCGNIHHAKDRKYICKCGYHTHRDLLGAINICNSTEYIGNRCIA